MKYSATFLLLTGRSMLGCGRGTMKQSVKEFCRVLVPLGESRAAFIGVHTQRAALFLEGR